MKFFRITSVLEGISYLVILSVTLGYISRELVFPLGMAHGVLFMVYMVLSLQVSHKQGWSMITWLLIFFASIIPFAFIPAEVFLRKQQQKQDSELASSDNLAESSAS